LQELSPVLRKEVDTHRETLHHESLTTFHGLRSPVKLLIINHPMTCNRYGFPGHLPEYKGYFGGFEVNFLPELKALHDAGYNILTYDLRNCGRSGEGNGGISGLGLLECRDVVGSVRHARQHPVMGKLRTSLFSRCMGGNSTIIAMAKWPDEFRHIEALALLNVVSGPTFIERGAENLGLDPAEAAKRLDQRCRETTGFSLFDFRPQDYGRGVTVPTWSACGRCVLPPRRTVAHADASALRAQALSGGVCHARSNLSLRTARRF
jgi:pimeloyl-ACP methyl ester carboxylesterase